MAYQNTPSKFLAQSVSISILLIKSSIQFSLFVYNFTILHICIYQTFVGHLNYNLILSIILTFFLEIIIIKLESENF